MDAKKLGAMPAHPTARNCSEEGMEWVETEYGLTKREAFAIAAMQGILANPVYDAPRRSKLAGMAEDAVSAADALLAKLAKDGAP